MSGKEPQDGAVWPCVYCAHSTVEGAKVMQHRIASAIPNAELRLIAVEASMLASEDDNEAGCLLAALRALAQRDQKMQAPPDQDSWGIVCTEGLVFHEKAAEQLRKLMGNMPLGADVAVLSYVVSLWDGARWCGRDLGVENISRLPTDRLQCALMLYLRASLARRIVAAVDGGGAQLGVDSLCAAHPSGDSLRAALCSASSCGIAGNGESIVMANGLLFAYPALALSDNPVHRHAIAMDGWNRKHYPNDSIPPQRESDRPVEAKIKAKMDTDLQCGLFGEADVVRTLWARTWDTYVAERWRTLGPRAWLLLEDSSPSATHTVPTATERVRIVDISEVECRRINALHRGEARDTPESALALLFRRLAKAGVVYSHLSIFPPEAVEPEKRFNKWAVDLAVYDLEKYEAGVNSTWAGWRTPLRARKPAATGELPPILPRVSERRRCADVAEQGCIVSQRMLAVINRVVGTWSGGSNVFLPTLASLQFGFSLASLDS